MKNILIAASMLAFAVSGADAQRIEPINKVVDCGQVTYQTPVTAEFEIKNGFGAGLDVWGIWRY